MRTFLVIAASISLMVFACSDDTPGTGPHKDGQIDGTKVDADGGPGSDADGAGNDAPGDGTPGDGTPNDSDGAGSDLINHGDVPQWDRGNTQIPDFFTLPEGGTNPGNQPTCDGKVYACADGIDNDNDGKIDAADPECTGPCDNDEASFGTGIPGDNKDPCKQDCFFDGNSGAGDDKCEWNLKCDPASPGAPKCPYDPNYKNCPTTQKADCLTKCRAATPNGCDCFGCCKIYTSTGVYTVSLGSGPTCSISTPQNCKPCTQTTTCINTCGECELCLGKTLSDLPAKCFITPDGGPTTPDLGPVADGSSSDLNVGDSGSGGSTDGSIPYLPICPGGQTACLDNSYCASGYYCLTGCCVHVIQ